MPEELEPIDPSNALRPHSAVESREVFAYISALPGELPRRAGGRGCGRPELRRGREGAGDERRPRSPPGCTVRAPKWLAGWIRAGKASFNQGLMVPPTTRSALSTPSTTSSPSAAARSSPPPWRRPRRRLRCASASRPIAGARRAVGGALRPPAPGAAARRRAGGRRRGGRRAARRQRERPERPRDGIVGHRWPLLPAPAEDTSNGKLLKASVEGVPFPYWGDSFQWEAVGARDDKIEGRSAKTVFYENPKGARAAYTILGGDTVDAPSGARKKTVNGIQLWITQDGGRQIVTWTRGGHTCGSRAARRARAEAARPGELEGPRHRPLLSDAVPPRHAAARVLAQLLAGQQSRGGPFPPGSAARLRAPAAARAAAARDGGGAPGARLTGVECRPGRSYSDGTRQSRRGRAPAPVAPGYGATVARLFVTGLGGYLGSELGAPGPGGGLGR